MTATHLSSTEEAVGAAGALDLLLTDAALGPTRRFQPGLAGVKVALGLIRQPRETTRQAVSLLHDYARITTGRSEIAPARGDRRFEDPAWTNNPLLKRGVQGYLATCQVVETLVSSVELNWSDQERMRLVTRNVLDAMAPSNSPLVSPVAWKAAADTGGQSVVAGLTHLAKDMMSTPRVPAMVEPDAFEVGQSVAATPGAVVMRTPIFELMQYTPQTPRVRSTPLLIVPPAINKYYVVDLAPGRSLIEYLVSQGQQVFVMSWRNPDARHHDWGLDVYGAAVIEALDSVLEITGVKKAHVFGLCSGGILASMVAGVLAAQQQQRKLASLALGVAVLDQHQAGVTTALLDESVAEAAIAVSARRGYLDGGSLAEVFAWLRPNDLIWNFWVNNYLQGRKPPPFDVLFWNADTTRMPATLHKEFINLARSNSLVTPSASTMLGSPVDLSAVTVDSYVVAGISDHICRWQSCYASTQLLGGTSRFVLSRAGHVACLVNPPTNPKSNFRTNDDVGPDADLWLAGAAQEQGSWWPDYAAWLGTRSKATKLAPEVLGSAAMPPLDAAPGTYVFDR